MFDAVTADLIRAAPALPGLEPASLVDELTAAYVEIAAARLAITAPEATDQASIQNFWERMGRLADTYEAMVVLDLRPEQRRSAAFVAASARQVMARIGRLAAGSDGPSRLDEDAVGAELAAALLFLIAERSSDAYEAAREIRAAGQPNPVRRALVLGVGRFAQGRFTEVLDIDVAGEALAAEGDVGRATDLLFRELLHGLQTLARAGLGLAPIESLAQGNVRFEAVRALSREAETREVAGTGAPLTTISLLAGPHHLALLLRRASDMLAASAVVTLPAPQGANAEAWTAWLRAEAARWPFLWENHRLAVATSYLDQGASLVMTTPTGSGKTTLAALKIAATLASGRTVLYLAPTHALVGQVERDLNERLGTLAQAISIDDAAINDMVQALPDVAVITPERCFALLTFAPELFANVGLLVFDECHLLGVAKAAAPGQRVRVGRRGIDAMLCLLTFMNVNSNADYLLLSAMVSNGSELAAWLQAMLKRPVHPFDYRWKPTRQLRACVTYPETELAKALVHAVQGKPPEEVVATPYGLFSLTAGWNPGAPDKLVLRPFSAAPVALKKGTGAWLTANRNEVAAEIGRAFAKSGLKVVVFCETIKMCVSTAKAMAKGQAALVPTYSDDQVALRDSVIAELGAPGAMYDAGAVVAAVHHGELLPAERQLAEGLFRRRESGLGALAATSTLAQGLNLPCEVVILAGTDRLDDADAEEKTRTSLAPHEILNALGRAGRAGLAATGLAIVVPGKPIGFAPDKTLTNDADPKVIFSEGDQCFPLQDPLTTLFDEIETYGTHSEDAQYLLRRLALSVGEERDGVETLERLARRSFGFHKMATFEPSAAETWLLARKAMLTKAIQDQAPPPVLPWQEELAAQTGASSAFIARLAAALPTAPVAATDAMSWVDWVLDQLDPTMDDGDVFLRPDTMIRVFGRAYTSQPNDQARRAVARDGTRLGMKHWLAGEPLVNLETQLSAFVAKNEGVVKRPTKPDAKAQRARRFAIRLASDLGFLCGVVGQVVTRVSTEDGVTPPPLTGFLPTLVRRGLATPYHFALSRQVPYPARPTVAALFEDLSKGIVQDPNDAWMAISDKLDLAQMKMTFSELPLDFELVQAVTGRTVLI